MTIETGDTNGAHVIETWTYAGVRERNGKRWYAWVDADGEEMLWGKLKAGVIGGRYEVPVTRDGEHVSALLSISYVDMTADSVTVAGYTARAVAASTRLSQLARERSDAKRNALDEAMAPLIAVARTLRTGPEREALIAHVIRKISAAW